MAIPLQFLFIILFAFSNSAVCNGIPSITEGSIFGTVYVPGEHVGSFSIPLTSGETLNYNTYDDSASRNYFPLMIWVTNFDDDPWSSSSLLSNSSLDSFLTSTFNTGNSHYLFIPANNEKDIARLTTAIAARSSELQVPEAKLKRLLFANGTIEDLSSSAPNVVDVLTQWPSFINNIGIFWDDKKIGSKNSSITRLDCYWPYGGSPSSLSDEYLLIDGGDGCRSNLADFVKNTDLSDKFLLVSAAGCDYDDAAYNAETAGAMGSLIMMRQTDPMLSQINKDGSYYLESYVTSISHDDGVMMRNAIKASTTRSLNISFSYELVSGYFLVIDSERKIQQLGAPLNAYMMLASWAGQHESFRDELRANLSKPVYTIPLIDGKYMNAQSRPKMIAPARLKRFGTMEIDTTITCPGDFDSECGGWDHTVTISVACSDPVASESSSSLPSSSSSSSSVFSASTLFSSQFTNWSTSDTSPSSGGRRLEVGGSRMEIARYVTPFGRRVGRWITDATPFMPLFMESSCRAFVVEADAGGGGWIVTSNLRLSDWAQQPPSNYSSLFSVFEYFRTGFNDNRTLVIDVPQRTSKVLLEAIITTHGSDEFGCCEFLPTMHTFLVNGIAFNLSFDEAGTAWGCSDKASEGSEPNEYGTWWYGRGGWCDGMDVKPWVVDVSSAVLGYDFGDRHLDESRIEETYQALMLYNGSWVGPLSSGASGYVIMSSNLIYYGNDGNDALLENEGDENADEDDAIIWGASDGNDDADGSGGQSDDKTPDDNDIAGRKVDREDEVLSTLSEREGTKDADSVSSTGSAPVKVFFVACFFAISCVIALAGAAVGKRALQFSTVGPVVAEREPEEAAPLMR